jgi:hypothetical protein
MASTEEPLTNKEIFKRIIWRSSLNTSASLEHATTCTLTGVAATVTLLISNLDSLAKLVSLNGIKAAILLFSLSLLALISKQVGFAVGTSLDTVKNLETHLLSDYGEQVMSGLTNSPNQLVRELAEPFIWPMSFIVRRAGERGASDHLATEKRLIRLFCIQVCANILHGLFAIGALAAIALSIIRG